MKSKISSSGQTLIEAVIVIAVGIIVVGALVFATIASLRNSQVAKNQAQATKLAQEGLEKIRTSRDRNGLINGLSGNNYCWANSCTSPTNPIWGVPMTQNICTPAPAVCYFKIVSGDLSFLSVSSSTPANGEPIGNFTRYIIVFDDANWDKWKNVTSLVIWNDFSGTHESRVSTVLRCLNC